MRMAILSFMLMASGMIWAQQTQSPAPQPAAAGPQTATEGAGREGWPEAIEDNSFLIEEAYNQEPGVVQWIFNGLYTRPNKLFVSSFTNEWPVPRETHQLSYTASWLSGGSGTPSGVGDLMLNYRYQLCMENKRGVAIAPRVSVILPTGDWRRGLGTGTTGWQINLPLSKRVSRSFTLHFNAGATYFPSAKNLGADGSVVRQNLWGTNQGASVIWLVSPRFNLMLEAVAFQQDQFSESGGKERVHQALISPGFRYAFNLPKGQLVVGASVPLGLTRNSPNSGVFLYLSWEAPVWKPR